MHQLTETALQFYSDAIDESKTFQANVSKELKRLSARLANISSRVNATLLKISHFNYKALFLPFIRTDQRKL